MSLTRSVKISARWTFALYTLLAFSSHDRFRSLRIMSDRGCNPINDNTYFGRDINNANITLRICKHLVYIHVYVVLKF